MVTLTKTGPMAESYYGGLVKGLVERDDYIVRQQRDDYLSLAEYFPIPNVTRSKLKAYITKGSKGVIGVPIDGVVDYSTMKITSAEEEFRYDKFAYALPDALLDRADQERFDPSIDFAKRAAAFFGRVQTWRQIKTLRAGAGNTMTLDDGERWVGDDASPNIEDNIAEAIATLLSEGDVPNPPKTPKILVIYPDLCIRAFNQHQDVMHTTMVLSEALKNAWSKSANVEIELIPFIPFRDEDKNLYIDIDKSSSDALADPSAGTQSAILCFAGRQTLDSGRYVSGVVPPYKVYEDPENGSTVYHRQSMGCQIIPNYGETASTTKIYRIDNVMANRS